MGRKLKYKTDEEKRTAACIWRMKYYWKNQEKEKKRNLKRYYKLKENI